MSDATPPPGWPSPAAQGGTSWWRRWRLLTVTAGLLLFVVVSGYLLLRMVSFDGVFDARDSHVHEIELGGLLPTAPPGRLDTHGVRDDCESDWFDKDPPVVWWEYTADLDAEPAAAAYRKVLAETGWRAVGDSGKRFRKEFPTWSSEVVVSADASQYGIYAYVVESDDCD